MKESKIIGNFNLISIENMKNQIQKKMIFFFHQLNLFQKI